MCLRSVLVLHEIGPCWVNSYKPGITWVKKGNTYEGTRKNIYENEIDEIGTQSEKTN
jgi:hypothetical protein